MAWAFWRKSTAPIIEMVSRRVPQPRERYEIPRDGDPWGIDRPIRATIIDVRDGWVRYRMDGHPCDDVKKIDAFLGCYSVGPIT